MASALKRVEKMMSHMESLLIELMDRVTEDIFDRQSIDPGCIYHYTNSAGLLGILQSGGVWTTNVHCLNDPREIDYGLNLCRDFLQQIKSAQYPNRTSIIDTAKIVIDSNESLLAPNDYQFVASFSLEKDLLSQWRGYADGGKGFSIGLRAMPLLSILRIDDVDLNGGTEPCYMPGRLIYGTKDQTNLLQTILETVFKWLDEIDPKGELSEDDTSDIARALALGLSKAAIFFKDSFFREEKEIRLLVSNAQEMYINQSPIRAATRATPDRGLIVYRSLSLKDDSGLLPIDEIIIGPSAEFESTRTKLEMALISTGYRDRMPEILKSEGALR